MLFHLGKSISRAIWHVIFQTMIFVKRNYISIFFISPSCPLDAGLADDHSPSEAEMNRRISKALYKTSTLGYQAISSSGKSFISSKCITILREKKELNNLLKTYRITRSKPDKASWPNGGDKLIKCDIR